MSKFMPWIFVWSISLLGCAATSPTAPSKSAYPRHENITATLFWVGEPGNVQSAFDGHWQEHFGGVDDPKHRGGFMPTGFVPKENPFYFALPYSDLGKGGRKADAENVVPWAKQRAWKPGESMCKNRWI